MLSSQLNAVTYSTDIQSSRYITQVTLNYQEDKKLHYETVETLEDNDIIAGIAQGSILGPDF